MSRKFISFLGAIPYEETRYFFNGDNTQLAAPTAYVQEAIFELELNNWQPTDEVIIFTTEEAEQKNYHNRITRSLGELEGQGLEKILYQLSKQGRIGSYKAVYIPHGNTEEEIWAVFQTVFQHIEEGDQLFFDITYGFRSLPMLGMVLLDYARTLRNVQIERIYYGNYEAGRALQKPGELVLAPVLDLTPFSKLQEWTAAAKAFLNGGNAEPIAALAEQNNPEISRNLRLFAPAILTCRGRQLAEDIDISSFKSIVDSSMESPIAAQLRPLLGKIQEKLSPFESKNLRNGLHAVKWCIDNGLIQQGYTFLQETIISLVVEKVFSRSRLTDKNFREDTGTALNNMSPNTPNLRIKTSPAEYEIVFKFVSGKAGLSKLYKKLTGPNGLRNDINHCGLNSTYATPAQLSEELNTLYKAFSAIDLH